MQDSYKSLHEALKHGGIANDARVDVQYFESESLESGDIEQQLAGAHGVLVPGGFGERGTEGKVPRRSLRA